MSSLTVKANSRFVNWRVGTENSEKEEQSNRNPLTYVAIVELVHLLEWI